MVISLAVLDYPSITDPAQKVMLLVEKQMAIFSTNLLMYMFFGIFLIALALALHDQLKHAAPAMMQVATAIGLIWAGSLVASGMVSNAGIHPVIARYASDPAQAGWAMATNSKFTPLPMAANLVCVRTSVPVMSGPIFGESAALGHRHARPRLKPLSRFKRLALKSLKDKLQAATRRQSPQKR